MGDKLITETEQQEKPIQPIENTVIKKEVNEKEIEAKYQKQIQELKKNLEEVKLKEITDEQEKEKYLFSLKEEDYKKEIEAKNERLKQLEEEKKNIEFTKEIEKLKGENPDLIKVINKINSWDKLNNFKEIKPELDEQITELKKLKDMNKQGNSNAFKNYNSSPKETNNSLYEQKLKEMKEKIIKK